MMCSERIRRAKWYKFVMSRSKTGEVKLYINGALCSKGSPSYKNHFQLNPHNIIFMRDDAGENSGGELANIRLYNKELSEKEVEVACECSKPSFGEDCQNSVIFNAPTSRTFYSSVWNNDKKGEGHGRGRIGSQQGWSSKINQRGQYMQMDMGKVDTVKGIVTQGRRDADQWVTSYTVHVSEDGSDWRQVGCGAEFDANKDRKTKVRNYFKPSVKARYVRIYPQSWYGHMSMRAGLLLCERPCKNRRLDYNFEMTFSSRSDGPSLDPAWGEGVFEGQLGYRFDAGQGFELDASRCLGDTPVYTMIMKVRLDNVTPRKALWTSDSWDDDRHGLYVDEYLRLAPTGANVLCDDRKILPNTFYDIGMTRTADGRVTLYLDGAACATGKPPFKKGYTLDTKEMRFLVDNAGHNTAGYLKSIRLWAKGMDENQVAAKCGCMLPVRAEAPCNLGLIPLTGTKRTTKYSSVLSNDRIGTGNARGRLGSRHGWFPAASKKGEWFQVDTGSIQTMAGVVTQGAHGGQGWVTFFTVKVSDDGHSWKDVRCQWVFQGNTDASTKQKTMFNYPVKARYIRIYPTAWYGRIAMRAGVLICMQECVKGELKYRLDKGNMLSITQGPALEAVWGSGYFDGDNGYKFFSGKGLQVDQDAEGCMNDHKKGKELKKVNPAYTLFLAAKMDNVGGWKRIVGSSGWGDFGLYTQNGQLWLHGGQIHCNEVLRAGRWYQIGMTRNDEGKIALYLNGHQCVTGQPSTLRGFKLDQNNIDFFHDDGGENTAGSVKEIFIYNRALTREQMAEESGCRLSEEGKKCPNTITFNPLYKQMSFSSVRANQNPGVGNGRGRLNSAQAWSAAQSSGVQWYQIDSGEVRSIAGVVTQRRRDSAQWVTRFTIQTSIDGISWNPVQCGEEFKGNDISFDKVKTAFQRPVKARYVRIYPTAWYGWISMRAGLMVCERKCIKGELNYDFAGSFMSTTKGPSLSAPFGEGSWDRPDLGYQVVPGQALIVDESRCVDPGNFTILIKMRLDSVSGWKKLMGSDGWGDYGLYVNDYFMMFPRASMMKCNERIRPHLYYTYMMTRTHDGKVSMYLNGYKCSWGLPPFVHGYEPSPTSLEFFRSDKGFDAAGWVQRIAVWDRALTDEECASESECKLSDVTKKCNSTISLIPPYSRMKYSSTWANLPMGGHCGAGRLGSPDAWCSSNNRVSEWVEIDTGTVRKVAGVVTQGRKNAAQWVTSYKVMTSKDGVRWFDVQCGATLQANTDMTTRVMNEFDSPVVARFIRIFPQSFYGHMSMRVAALICEKACQGGQLDYQLLDDFESQTLGPELQATWGYNTFSLDNGYRFYSNRGLSLDESACIDGADQWTVYIKVKLDFVHGRRRLISSQGWGDDGLYVNNGYLTMFPTAAELKCKEYIMPNTWYKIGMSRTEKGKIALFINGYSCGSGYPTNQNGFALNEHSIIFFHDDGADFSNGWVRRIRLWDRALGKGEMADVSGCRTITPAEACKDTIIYSPPYRQIKYSSVFGNDPVGVNHGRGRLNSPQSWSSRYNLVGEWFQIDVLEPQSIAGVVTQGRRVHNQWVTGYKVSISVDGKQWRAVQCGMTFAGNTDRDTKVEQIFDEPFRARYIRIYPQSWLGHMSMRAGVLLCERPCQNDMLEYPLRGSFLSRTKGPSLTTPWGFGFFSANDGFRFEKGQGLALNEKNCIGNEWTLSIEARVDTATGYRRILGSEPWGDYGLYIMDNEYLMFPRTANLRCKAAYIEPNRFYTFWLSRGKKGEVKIYINGYLCSKHTPALKNHFALAPDDVSFFHDEGSENTAGFVKQITMWGKQLTDEEVTANAACAPAIEDKVCDKTVLYSAPYSRIVYSSVWGRQPVGVGHGTGKLDGTHGWSAAANNLNQFMQIDTKQVQTIAGVVTQGRAHHVQFVTAFTVEVSSDGESWQLVQCNTPFKGNKGSGPDRVTTIFDKPVKGRYVKIRPTSWHGHITMRAAVLLCEKPCVNKELDYALQDSFMSSTDGPALEAVWGEGTFQSLGYKFGSGKGLALAQSSCLKDSKEYSIIIDAKLDNTQPFNRLLAADGWGRYGLFVEKGKFELYPEDLEMVCPGKIFNGDVNKFGITRSNAGEVKLYLNGYMCAQGDPIDAPKGLELNPEQIEFFRDPANLHSSGTVSRIRLWNSVLNDDEMAKASGCRRPKPSDSKCKGTVIYNPPYSRIRYSDVLYNFPVGQGWGRGRLNSPMGWIAPNYGRGWWMQIDTGKVQAIAGVVTQGRGDGWWWTSSFFFKVSEDGRKWRQVECGRIFDGNTDFRTRLQTFFARPLKARYVRIYPQTSVGYPSLRAGALLCEEKCKSAHLDYRMDQTFASQSHGPSLTAPFGDGIFTKTNGYRFNKGQGLQVDEQSCIKNVKTWSALIYARFDLTDKWRAIISADDWGGNGLFVGEGLLTTKPQDLTCREPIRANYWYKFGMTRGEDGQVRIFLNGYMCAEGSPASPMEGFKLVANDIQVFKGTNDEDSAGYVKRVQFWGTTLTSNQMASASGCSLASVTGACKGTNIMMVRYGQMRSSSNWGNYPMGQVYNKGELNSDICWMSGWGTQGNKKEWLQLDTEKIQSITGVVTRGAHARNWFTRTFKLKVSEDGRVWKWVECGRIFDGNKDWHTKVTNMFDQPVKARYIRFYPETYYYYQAMRVAVIVCEADCKDSTLDFRLRSSFTSSTGGPQLEATNGEGLWTTNKGYRFYKDKGLSLDEHNCLKKEKLYTALINVRLDKVDGWNGILTSSKWGENGLYVADGVYMLRPTEIVCNVEKIRVNTWYKLGMTRSGQGAVTLFINGYPCATGTPKSNGGFVLKESDLDFLEGPDGQSSSGYVKRIQLWGKGMTDEEMQDVTSCRLAKEADGTCTGTVIFNAPYQKIRASTVFAGHRISEPFYFGRARLNARGAWCASHPNTKQWLQIDTGKKQNIAGIVTEGRYYTYQWVTSYKVTVSSNGFTWRDVECGRIFDGNTDYWTKVKNEFAKPVEARYVRIHPVSWYNWIAMRAGVLLCEGDCNDKKLEYNFNDELSSSTDGPSLKPEWGEGTYNAKTGYRVHSGQGMLLKQTPCIKKGDEYSIMVLARLDHVSGWKQIIGSTEWGSSGAYAYDTKFSLKPASTTCNEVLYKDYYYWFGMTRSKKGLVKLYLNGWPCAEGKPSTNDGLKLANDLTFFYSEDKEHTGAWVKKIQVWGKTLGEDDMASEAQCTKPTEADNCTESMEYIVPDSRTAASSVRWGYWFGAGWGQAQLNSAACWAPAAYNDKQYLQLDLGKKMTVSGVRTQGDGGWYRWYFGPAWIKAYWIDVSNDGSTWKKVECGKIFQGNTDTDTPVTITFDKPLDARYVRIKPQTWRGWGCMRAAVMVCEETCKSKMLDYTLSNSLASTDGGPPLSTPWGFSHYFRNFRSAKSGYRFWHGRGLKITGEDACIKKPAEWSLLVSVSLDKIPKEGAVNVFSTSDWGDNGLYISDQHLQMKPNMKLKCDAQKILPGPFYKYGITRDNKGTMTLFINGLECAQGTPKANDGFELKTKDVTFFQGKQNQHTSGYVNHIQLWGKTLSAADMLDVSGCTPATTENKKCDTLVANVKYSQMRFSSTAGGYSPGITGYAKGRLNSNSGWWPAHLHNQWFQMDSGKVQSIMGVVTQGRQGAWYWVQTFKVEVSDDSSTWMNVECGRIFEGNTDFSNQVKTHFDKPVKARYVRILPQTWYNYPSMRAGLLLCEDKCDSGHLDYQMDGLRSTTGGPALTAPWGEGEFVPQVMDQYTFYHHYDIGFHWVNQEQCDKLCAQNPDCAGYVTYSSGYPGCWLKSQMSQIYRYESQWYNSYFNTKSLTYKTQAPVGFSFQASKGLSLDPQNCIKDTKSYSIIIVGMVRSTNAWKRILSSTSWGDKGLYIKDSKLTMWPQASGLMCDGVIRPDYVYTFGITRSDKGEVKLYLNGYKCAEAFPAYADGYKLNSDNVDFFHDQTRHYNTGGVIRRIQLWDQVLSEDEMGVEAGCRPSTTYKNTCQETVLHKPTLQQVDFSSTMHRDDIGYRYGGGYLLDGVGNFMPGRATKGQWMQIDLGEVRNITGVVTVGYVTAFTISVSKDGHEWTDVECGRMFETPWKGWTKDKSTFEKMNEGRFLRLIMNDWVAGHPQLRMQVQYCKPEPPPVKEKKKVDNPCKGKDKSEKCNPCASKTDTKNGKDTTEAQCTGEEAKNKDLCTFEKGVGCYPKDCKKNDYDCYLTAFDSSKKAIMNAPTLSSIDFSCQLYDYGAYRPMPDVTLKAKCNADLRCQHKSGCGCLGKGVTCAHPSAQEEAESSVEAEDRVMARHSPLVDQEGEKEVAQSQRMQMRTPDGESMTVMTSEGVVDVGQDESDPLGLVKAMDEKTGAGKAGARERGDTRSEGVSDHGPYKEDYLGLHPEEDATVHVHEGRNQANDEPSLEGLPEDGVREQEERQADDGGGPLKQISDVESVLAGGVQYPQAQGVGKVLEHADQDMEVLGSDRLPQDHSDDLQKQRGMESVVARYL